MAKFSPTGKMLEARGLYRRWLAKHFSTVTLAGLAPDDEPILLRQIYVPLVLTPERVSEYEREEAIHEEGRPIEDWLVKTEAADAGSGLRRFLGRFVEIGQMPRTFLISGEAGSGKTTLVSSLVDSLAGTAGDTFNRRFEGYVPFPIQLREAPVDRIVSLSDLVSWWLASVREEEKRLVPEELTPFLDAGHAVLLLDGLDEVGTYKRRSRVLRWLTEHRWTQGSTPNIAIVTARPSGFEGFKDTSLPPSWSLHVAPFSRDQIRQYLERWFELRPMMKRQREDTVEALLHRLTSPDQAQRLLPLARRPAYLASLAFVHGTRGELPYTRASLYELLIDAYIEMLDRQRGLLRQLEEAGSPAWDRQEKLEVLSAVAFQAHVGATGSDDNPFEPPDRRFLWSRAELKEAVRNAILYGGDRLRTIRQEHAELLTNYFLARTGLLVETREGHYQFGHLSFQEYLTALFLLNLASASTDKVAVLRTELLARLGQPGWLEVALLALAIDSNRSGGKGHPPVLGALDLAGDPAQFSLLSAVLAGEELRLTPEERRAWLLVWVAHGGAGSDQAKRVAALPSNRAALEEVWRATCEALAAGGTLQAALQALAKKKVPGAAPPESLPASTIGQLLGSRQDSAVEIPLGKLTGMNLPAAATEEEAAAVLRLPLRSATYPEGAAEQLLPVVRAVELFPAPERWVPSPVWFALDDLSLVFREITAELAERTPLLWWLADDFFAMRMAGSAQERGSEVLGWRSSSWLRTVRIERLWWVDLLVRCADAFDSVDTAEVTARARDLARALARDLARARTLDRDLARARDLARDLDRALDRARDLARALDLARARILDRALDRALARGKKISEKTEERQRFYFLAVSFLNVLALGNLHRDLGAGIARRGELEAALATLRDPKDVTAGLSSTVRPQAEQEWAGVLNSPLSPVPLLEDLLSRDWRELPVDEESVLKIFERGLDSLSA